MIEVVIAYLRVGHITEIGGRYIFFFCLFSIVMTQLYPTIFWKNNLPLHMEAAMIIGAE